MILWLSFVSLALIYGVMLLGIYITASHQGLSCPGWPLCPNGFGLPEGRYLTEYIHRLLAVVTASLVYATAIVVPCSLRKAKIASIIAAIVISVQLIIGYFTVTTALYPLIVATHLSSGITVFAFGLITFLWIRFLKRSW